MRIPTIRARSFRFAVIAGAIAAISPFTFDTPGSPGRFALARLQAQEGSITGRLVDAASGSPVPNAQVRLREVGRVDLSHSDGSFHFSGLGPREYTIVAQRIGFAPGELPVAVVANDTTFVELRMEPSALELTGVIVTGTGRERREGETYRPSAVVGEAELRRRLEVSLAGTISHVPGITQQYNGPAASQPVVRGMKGDRVLVLEDGQRTGDLSTTAADHAVSLDPLTAQRIEIVRGPAGLMYGSNALGGVINVVREEVPRSVPERLSGTVSVQGESVNGGTAGGAALLLPVGRFALRGEVNGRSAGDTSTPLGDLESSDVRAYGASVGGSLVAGWGHIGAALRLSDLDYGVPGQFDGQLIPGAHPDGVEIQTRREVVRFEAARHPGSGPVSSISLEANLVRYRHSEIEGATDGRPIVGASFENLSGSADLLVQHQHDGGRILTEGALGVSATARELTTGGGFTGSRDAEASTLAAFLYEELQLDLFRFQLGGRYDLTRITPNDRSPIQTGELELPVRDRTFGSISASAAALMEPRPGFVIGASLARAFRTPSVEELFSDGPHLADYSYDIGNPELDPEIGIGGDLFVRVSRPRLQAEISFFRNELRNYIYHAPTAELDPRFNRFPLFVARGSDARFVGAEAGIQWEALPRLVLDGSVSYVRATRIEDGDPLPSIPPLNGMLEARYERGVYYLTAGWEAAAAQNRVPHPFPSPIEEGVMIAPERPTRGYDLVNFGAGLRLGGAGSLHTLTLQIDNALDTVWRQHLSRIKEVAPQPGRNVQVMYRVGF
jgi:iron complex outermembrane recepter protein